MSDDATDRMMMETLYWWGVPTLFRAPYAPDFKDCDIALVGVPHSSGNGSTERDQHLGPRAVRHVSAHNRRYHKHFDFSPWEAARICDVGDVPLPEAMDNEKCVERISAFFRKVADARHQSCFDRRRSRHHRRHHPGDRGRGEQAYRWPQGSTSPSRCPYRCLREYRALAGREEIGGTLGGLSRAPGQSRSTRSVQIGMRGNPRTRNWLNLPTISATKSSPWTAIAKSVPEPRSTSSAPDRRHPALHHLRSRLPRSGRGAWRFQYRSRRHRLVDR